MDHMVVGHKVGRGWIEMTRSKMENYWIHLICEALNMGFILALVQTFTMVIISIILIG